MITPSEYAFFTGNKVIIDNSNLSEYSPSIDHLLDTKLIGFDLEHVPDYYTFINSSSRKCKPSIVQICGDSICFIYLLYKIGHVPESLSRILDSKDLLKVAHGAPSDMRLMFRHYGTRCSNFVDLIDLCSRNNISPASLKNATESVLKLKLCKKQQCSNWEADELNSDQISYASTDAWVAREIFLRLAPPKLNKLFVNSDGDIETE
ncbi:hypothetical protein MACK_003460 [Theileria orientalis]|uniref:3'-5' exonuclease n=1 Tax=Theileria orientalis TaxID=68886 RepID=A0A976XJA3_THEOR|nr:hypothetical protein MACK_003460 [Theileria orientalis]